MAPDQKARTRIAAAAELRCLESGHGLVPPYVPTTLMRFKRVVPLQLPPRTYCRKTYTLIASGKVGQSGARSHGPHLS